MSYLLPRINKKIITFAVLALVVFLFPKTAHAWQLYDVSLAVTKTTDNSKFWPQQVVFPDNTCINTISLLFANPQTSASIVIASSTKDPNSFGIIWDGVVTSTGPTPTTTYYTFFASSTLVTPTRNRPFCPNTQSIYFITANNVNFMMSTNSSTYTNATYWDHLGYSSQTYSLGTQQPNDMWIGFDQITQSGTSINFIATPTTTCDFQNWSLLTGVRGTDVAAAYNTWSIGVHWGYGSALYEVNDNDQGAYFQDPFAIGILPANIPKKVPISEGGNFYSAEAYICKYKDPSLCDYYSPSSNFVAKSTIYSFILGNDIATGACATSTKLFSPGFSWPITTTTANGSVQYDFNCEGLAGLENVASTSSLLSQIKITAMYAMCKMGEGLFNPSAAVFDKFTALKSQISKKPPFGYINIYGLAINNLNSASSTTSTAFTTDRFGKDLPNSEIQQISIFSYLRNAITFVLYLGFVFYVYHRLKNFSLHG